MSRKRILLLADVEIRLQLKRISNQAANMRIPFLFRGLQIPKLNRSSSVSRVSLSLYKTKELSANTNANATARDPELDVIICAEIYDLFLS